jgi:hypothetical protein
MSGRTELAKNVATGALEVARGVGRVAMTSVCAVLEPTLHGRTPAATKRKMENEPHDPDATEREKIIGELDTAWILSMLRFLASLPIVTVTDVVNRSMNNIDSLPDHWLYLIPTAYLVEFVFTVLYRIGWGKNHPQAEPGDQNPLM